MTRSLCVKRILSEISDDDIIVASTGYISRELFYQKDRPLNFYMMGSMGCALGIGIGLALNLKQRVIVINGDGSALMSLGTMITLKKLQQDRKLNNLAHFILDNNCHESTGGQKTASDLINFAHLAKNTIVYKIQKETFIPPRINMEPNQITRRFKDAIQALNHKQV